ncbi:MAG: single-stranded DNA-binding protein [Erysipelothrix sp.]|jgi:single-strand DNA-binding protein|nr:single-stranded DNA-binding protein [Erysipelothrix sp.]
MLNKAIIIGRFTRDLELRKTQNGKSVLSFTLASSRKYGGNEQVDYVSCTVWEKGAEIIAQYMKKGSLIQVEGRNVSRSYDDKDGKKVYVQEVLVESFNFLDSRSSSTQNTSTSSNYSNQYNTPQSNYTVSDPYADFASSDDQDGPLLDISSDDLPF